MRRRRVWALVALVGTGLLGSCATPDTKLPSLASAELKAEAHEQRKFVLKSRAEDFARVQNVAYRVLKANHKACPKNAGPSYGLHAINLQAYEPADQAPARELWNLDERLTVAHVVPGSPAAAAGLESGDRIVAVNGRPAPKGKGAVDRLTEMMSKNSPARPAKLVYARGETRKQARLTPVVACTYPVRISSAGAPNAFTDGSHIVVNRGVLRIVEGDDQLALVVAHELAHITKGHFEKKLHNGLLAGAGGLVGDVALLVVGFPSGGTFAKMAMREGQKAFSKEFEREADYVGMYYMANAGYDTSGVEDFWDHMGGENPHSFAFAGSHPSGPERYLLVRATHKEIDTKLVSGEDLTPNLKDKSWAAGAFGSTGAAAPARRMADER